jgi:multiple antibiotic resistance protein
VTLHDVKLAMSLARMGAALAALAVIGVLLYLAFRYGEHLLRLIGEAGTAVFLRLTAFILLCLGVQIVWDGARELMLEIMSTSTI